MKENLADYGIKELKGTTFAELQIKHSWILEADISEAIISINDFGGLVWNNGTWENGTWKGGIRERGIHKVALTKNKEAEK